MSSLSHSNSLCLRWQWVIGNQYSVISIQYSVIRFEYGFNFHALHFNTSTHQHLNTLDHRQLPSIVVFRGDHIVGGGVVVETTCLGVPIDLVPGLKGDVTHMRVDGRHTS